MKRGWLLLATSVLGVACIDLSTDPDEIVAITFAPLPWPSIVAGDTLRDASGAIAPLTAKLFDADGDEVTGQVEFLPQMNTVRVISGNLLVAESTATGLVGLIASTAGLQSTVTMIDIVPRPDSIAPDGSIAPLDWVVPDDPNLNTSQPIRVRIFSKTATGATAVRSWIVRYQLEAAGRQIPENDTTQIFLVGDNGRPSYADTTDQSGTASRRVRLRVAPGLTPPDSAVITVTASYRGVPLLRSPLILVLPLNPR